MFYETCEGCGTRVPVSARFCPYCGTRVVRQAEGIAEPNVFLMPVLAAIAGVSAVGLTVFGLQWAVEATCASCVPGMPGTPPGELENLKLRIVLAGAALTASSVTLLVLWIRSLRD